MCIQCCNPSFSFLSVEINGQPLAFMLNLPFAFLSSLLSAIGAIIWIFGMVLSCICPCCFCVTGLLHLALGLIKAPVSVMEWFIKQIPC